MLYKSVLTVVGILVAYVIKSVLGFGHAMVAVPALGLSFSLPEAITIAALGDLVCNGVLLFKERKSIKTSILRKVGPGLFIGAFIGVAIISNVNEVILKKILGGFILVYLLISAFKPKLNLKKNWQKTLLAWVMGLIGGISGGVINTNGPAIYLYLNSVSFKKEVIRANLILVFFLDCLWRTGLYASKGLINFENLKLFILLFLPLMMLGLFIGSKIDKSINSKGYAVMSKSLMVITAIRLIF